MQFNKNGGAVFVVALLSGCGGSGDSGTLESANQTTSSLNSLNPIDCDSGSSALGGCWASVCEADESSAPNDPVYSRSVISFQEDQSLPVIIEWYDNSNCMGEPLNISNPEGGLTYKFVSLNSQLDGPNVDGRISITMPDILEEFEGDTLTNQTPYDVNDIGQLCMDEAIITFQADGFQFNVGGPGNGYPTYQNCLMAVE